jgi:poly-gamma-glutamate synthesis protein (capsule biosynthesis protein)
VSIHWGGNWGYHVPSVHRSFAHALISSGLVDAVHGHSSHHPKSIEVFEGKLILYGCGDFLNDYEGISGQEEYRADLTLMYFPTFDCESGRLLSLRIQPMQIRKFQLKEPGQEDVKWILSMLNRERLGSCEEFLLEGHGIVLRTTNPAEPATDG